MSDQPVDLKALREAAEKATPGPWMANLHHTAVSAGRTYGFVFADGVVPVAAITIGVEGMPQDEGRANATLIALANPAAILSLLARLDALEEGLKPFNLDDIAEYADVPDEAVVHAVILGDEELPDLRFGSFRRASTLLKDS